MKGAANFHPRGLSDEPIPLSPTTNDRILRARTRYSAPHPGVNSSPPSPTSVPAPRKWTQEDQDQSDADLRRSAMKELVQTWMDRLQLISVITTFFAATEAQLLGVTVPGQVTGLSASDKAANAGLAGALVVHVFAAILSFFAAFFLIRYRLREATREEIKAELSDPEVKDGPIFSTNPHLETVGPFRRGQPPILLLENCHTLCMLLSGVGFILALVGVLCFAWARMPTSVSIFASVCLGVCVLGGVFAVLNAVRGQPKMTID